MVRKAIIQESANRWNEVLLGRAAYVGGVVLGLSVIVYGFLGDVTTEKPKGEIVSAAEKVLHTELHALRAAWQAKERTRILQGAPGRVDQFRRPMRTLLATTDHPLLEPGVEYAAAMGDAKLRELLTDLIATPASLTPELRSKAVLAADALGAFTTTELRKLLGPGHPVPVTLATLQICAAREDAPAEQILQLLEASEAGRPADPAIQRAAAAAFPARPDTFQLQSLWAMVTSGEADRCALGLAALHRVSPSRELTTRLLTELPGLSESAAATCIELLRHWGERLASPEPVWNIVQSDDMPLGLRSQAFHCLEHTRSFDLAAIRSALPLLPPRLKVAAARCMMVANDPRGPALLLEILEDDDPVAVTTSRQLLAWFLGMSPGATVDAFERALETRARDAKPRTLPAPARPAGPAGPADGR